MASLIDHFKFGNNPYRVEEYPDLTPPPEGIDQLGKEARAQGGHYCIHRGRWIPSVVPADGGDDSDSDDSWSYVY